MCGIAADFSIKSLDLYASRIHVENRISRMASRGPDASKVITVSKNLVMGHNRLAIIGLGSDSDQPMAVDNRYYIVFNGEIYNYRAIKKELIDLGEIFQTQSDTEVILRGFKRFKYKIFDKLRGMFSIIIFDQVLNELTISRDPFGIKPLYYIVDNGLWSFSSSLCALRDTIGKSPSRDKQAELMFDWFGFVPEPKTIYENVFSIATGQTLVIGKKGAEVIPQRDRLSNIYLKAKSPDKRICDSEEVQGLYRQIGDSVSAHLTADVPLGLFLSAGIDSSLIAVCASEDELTDLYALTLGFESLAGTRMDEVPCAKTTAEKLGMPFYSEILSAREVKEGFADYCKYLDQPSIDGNNVFLLSKLVNKIGIKAVLAGTGADELLGGYSFFNYAPLASYVKSNRLFKTICRFLGGREASSKVSKLFDDALPYNDLLDTYLLARSLATPSLIRKKYGDRDFFDAYNQIRENFSNDLLVSSMNNKMKLMYFDQLFYLKNQLLRDSDCASMARSIELRVPFVDKKLLKYVLNSGVPKRKNVKKMLAQAILLPISNELVNRKKSGFAIPSSEKKFDQEDYKKSLLNRLETIVELF
jgi:asparagine synthase (glutamine-hydrolysing)